jgi:hypothetical protein
VTDQENDDSELQLCIEEGPDVRDCCSGDCFVFNEDLTGGIPTEVGLLTDMIRL